jgi:hypothetical protein
LVVPGPVRLSFSGKVLKPITHFVLNIEMKKHGIFGTRFSVPCFSGIGNKMLIMLFYYH